MKIRPMAAAVVTVLTVLTLTSCSSAGTTTCQEYASLSSSDRSSLERDLLSEHELDTGSFSNVSGLGEALQEFCGLSAFDTSPTSAGKNAGQPLDNAVDWDSSYW